MAFRSTIASSRCSLSRPNAHCRTFTCSTRCMVNPLLNLSHFSASKEAQFFSKERKIPRVEFSPYLELIRSSEVDIFAPAPGASPTVVAALKRAQLGQSDMQTAYSLALSNLNQHLQQARDEATQAHIALARVHEKYKREERNAFIVMITGVAMLSFVLLKTDALEDLKVYAQEVASQWRGFDWQWLGNPPSHKKAAHGPTISASNQETQPTMFSTPNGTPILPLTAHSDQQARSTQLFEPQADKTQPISRWTVSRLFWAAPSKSE